MSTSKKSEDSADPEASSSSTTSANDAPSKKPSMVTLGISEPKNTNMSTNEKRLLLTKSPRVPQNMSARNLGQGQEGDVFHAPLWVLLEGTDSAKPEFRLFVFRSSVNLDIITCHDPSTNAPLPDYDINLSLFSDGGSIVQDDKWKSQGKFAWCFTKSSQYYASSTESARKRWAENIQRMKNKLRPFVDGFEGEPEVEESSEEEQPTRRVKSRKGGRRRNEPSATESLKPPGSSSLATSSGKKSRDTETTDEQPTPKLSESSKSAGSVTVPVPAEPEDDSDEALIQPTTSISVASPRDDLYNSRPKGGLKKRNKDEWKNSSREQEGGGGDDSSMTERDIKFNRLFRLTRQVVLREFPCVWKRKTGMKATGLLYVSQECIGFSAQSFGFKTRELIILNEITDISLEKAKKNEKSSITISIGQDHVVVLTSFREPDQAYALIRDLWDTQKRNTSGSTLKGLSSTGEDVTGQKEKRDLKPTEEDWALILKGATMVTFKKDEYVIRENQPSQQLYQVVSGRTRIEKKGVPGVLGFIGHDDGIFGQISFLEGVTATASIIADEDTTVHIIEAYFLNILFQHYPHLAGRFYHYLAGVLAQTVSDREKASAPASSAPSPEADEATSKRVASKSAKKKRTDTDKLSSEKSTGDGEEQKSSEEKKDDESGDKEDLPSKSVSSKRSKSRRGLEKSISSQPPEEEPGGPQPKSSTSSSRKKIEKSVSSAQTSRRSHAKNDSASKPSE